MLTRVLLPVLACSLVAPEASADMLVLRDGKSFSGTFLGGNARQVEFLPESGETLKVPIDRVKTLAFAEEPPPAPAPPPARRRQVVLPAGTPFRVRTLDPIDVDVTQAGAKFRGTIDDPMMAGGDVIVPRGADVVLIASKVKQGGRMKGSDLVELKVNTISVGGRAYQVATTLAEAKSGGEGKKTSRKIIGGAGLGAIVGGIAGGGTGAAIGAVAGGAGGTAMAAAGQPHLKVPPETRLDFQLQSDWKLP
jgi:hypothetical protein